MEIPGWLIFVAIAVGIYMLVRINTWRDRAQHVQSINKYRDDVESSLRKKRDDMRVEETKLESFRAALKRERELLDLTLSDTQRKYPWAAKIHGDLLAAEAAHVSWMLEAKRRPAMKAAEAMRDFKAEVRERLQRLKYAEYKSNVYESAFPFLLDFIEGVPTADLAVIEVPPSDEPERNYLSAAEYAQLSAEAKFQRALDRYLSRRKSNWEIGRDYERFVGYKYESQGWEVEYHGAIRGLEDLGRDLIAKRPGETHIVQCKHWAQWRDVHENAIFQLFGSVVDYLFENRLLGVEGLPLLEKEDVFAALKRNGVKGVFVTSTTLSTRAELACQALGIEVRASSRPEAYPMIKCNVGRSGDKLFHLPFDQQYDRIKIEPEKGEFYANTVAEAMNRGFRRAFRWRGERA